MFKVQKYLTPCVFSNLFVRNTEIHSYRTRQADQYHVPHARTNYMQNAISIKGANVWNKISQKVNYDCSYLSFKIALKKYIINNLSMISYVSQNLLNVIIVFFLCCRRQYFCLRKVLCFWILDVNWNMFDVIRCVIPLTRLFTSFMFQGTAVMYTIISARL